MLATVPVVFPLDPRVNEFNKESVAGMSPAAIAGIVAGFMIVAVGVGVGIFYFMKRRQRGNSQYDNIQWCGDDCLVTEKMAVK